MRLELSLLTVLFRAALRRPSFWWISLGFFALGTLSPSPGLPSIPFLASAVCCGLPVALLYSWRSSRELREMVRLLSTSPRGPWVVLPVEMAATIATSLIPCALFALVSLLAAGSVGPPWQIWPVISMMALVHGAAWSLLAGHRSAGLFLLLLLVAVSSVTMSVREPLVRLLLVPSYPLEIWGWHGLGASASDGSTLHPDIYLAASVLLSAAAVPTWLLRRRGLPRV